MKPDQAVFPAQGWDHPALSRAYSPGDHKPHKGGKTMGYTFADCIRYAIIVTAVLLVALIVLGFSM